MARRATNNPRQIRLKSCGCPLCTEEFRPGQKATRKDCKGTWQARYRDMNGNQKARNFPTMAKAEAFLDEVRTRVRNRDYNDPDRGKVTLTWLWDKWRPGRKLSEKNTLAAIDYQWSIIEPRWGAYRLCDIEYLDIQAWVPQLIAQGHAPSVVNKVVELLSRLLKVAVRDNRRIPYNPCEGVEKPPPRKVSPEDRRSPSYRQLDLIRAAMPKHHEDMLEFLEETGLRWSELIGLRRCYVDRKKRVVKVRHVIEEITGHPLTRKEYPKTEEGFRTIPLSPRALAAFDRHMERCPASDTKTRVEDGLCEDELVFRGARGGILRKGNFWTVYTRAAVRAGVARKIKRPSGKFEWWPTVHDTRGSWASRLHDEGVPEVIVQRLMGHKRASSVTWIYLHAAEDAVDQGREALEGRGSKRHLRAVGE